MNKIGALKIDKHELIVIGLAMVFFFGILYISFESINYSPTGNTISSVQIEKAEDDICNFTLTRDENLVSFHCIRGAMPRDMMLEPIKDKYESVFTYNPDNADLWKSYNPSLPSWVEQDLTLIEDKAGLWLFMKEDSMYVYNGSKSERNITSLKNGWNLIGYPTSVSKDIVTSLASVDGNYNIILAYNSSRYCQREIVYINDSVFHNGQEVKVIGVNETYSKIKFGGQTISIFNDTKELYSELNNLAIRIYDLHYEVLENQRYVDIGVDCESPDIPYLNQTSDKWESYGPQGDGTLTNMTPDRGYWIYMNSNDDLVKTW